MFWAIVPVFGPCWECDLMDSGVRDVRTAPPCALASSSRAYILILSCLPFSSAGCQSFVSPLAQWRAAYDGNLVKGPSKDEMADVSGPASSDRLLDRWITPRRSPTDQPKDKSSTLILGSDGWKPMTKTA